MDIGAEKEIAMCAVTQIHIALPDAQAELIIYGFFPSELCRLLT